jgi:hypothetical protein
MPCTTCGRNQGSQDTVRQNSPVLGDPVYNYNQLSLPRRPGFDGRPRFRFIQPFADQGNFARARNNEPTPACPMVNLNLMDKTIHELRAGGQTCGYLVYIRFGSPSDSQLQINVLPPPSGAAPGTTTFRFNDASATPAAALYVLLLDSQGQSTGQAVQLRRFERACADWTGTIFRLRPRSQVC